MFDTFEFDHPHTDETRVIGRRAHVWAALFGPFYILSHGFVLSALLMVLVSAIIAVAAFVSAFLVIEYVGSPLGTVVALFLAPIAALVAQGEAAIELLRRTYLRRGWRGGYY